MQTGADLAEELRKLGSYTLKSRADAEIVCDALEWVASRPSGIDGESGLHSLVALFQEVDGAECPAFPALRERGTLVLVRIVDDAINEGAGHKQDDLLFVLKILAMYGTRAGSEAVLRAAQLPLKPDAYMWSVILRAYTADHPERERLFRELGRSLPTEFLAVSLLDSANAAHQAGVADPHPFDSPAGVRQIERWITDKDEEHFSYAVSAVAALPFLMRAERDNLLALAFDHPSIEVQMEAAWAAAKLGREAGIKWLARCCLDVNLSARAQQYLKELERPDAIPPECRDPAFEAKAEFAQWLMHPNELGRAPDELRIIDHRELPWPPEREQKPFWLLEYRLKDQTGLKEDDIEVGLVGSVTFCLFSYKLTERPPEDAYAIHCYWEMECRGLITEADVADDSAEYDAMLRRHAISGIENARIIAVAECSPELQYPQPLVALATATRDGQPGWLVLDGTRSRWYAKAEMPADVLDKIVLKIHVGRTLLGFADGPDRRKFLRQATTSHSPEQIVAAFEGLLAKARSSLGEAKKLLGGHSVLASAFPKYVAALASVRSESISRCACAAYEGLLAAATEIEGSVPDEVFDSFAPLGENFDRYVGALVELGRNSEVTPLIEKFQPYWNHNLGYGKLGSAAFKCGNDSLAESLITRLRHSLKGWQRCEEMDSLAKIWCRKGRPEEARQLLIDAMNGLVEESRSAEGSDRNLYEEWFQARRSAYLELFALRGEAELERLGIPSSTL